MFIVKELQVYFVFVYVDICSVLVKLKIYFLIEWFFHRKIVLLSVGCKLVRNDMVYSTTAAFIYKMHRYLCGTVQTAIKGYCTMNLCIHG